MSQEIIKKLDDDLIIRCATVDDTEALVSFNSEIHKDEGDDEPNEYIKAWVRDLMTKPHPTTKPGDFTVVVDSNSGKIVSSLNLIPQTWSYEGVAFEVGRPELVGTDPEYRRRGLIRKQFDVIHNWSAERGHLMQAITGIPYYYRQFGYEMCLNLGGVRIGYQPHIPKLDDDKEEGFTFDAASRDDIPFIAEIYNNAVKRSMISCVRDEKIWEYEICMRSEKASAVWMIIKTTQGEPVGFVQHGPVMWGPNIQVWGYELKPGASYLDVTPSVIRYLEKAGIKLAENKEKIDFQGYSFSLGADHPVYDTLPERMPRVGKPYAWYIRIPDLVRFLTQIRKVLEKRLSESPAVGYSGDLKLSFHKSALKIAFETGVITSVENYTPEDTNDGDVYYPERTFLQALVGYKSFDELTDNFPDCYARNDHGRALAKFLFPKKPSNVWVIN